jgi:hypothetical protein
MYRSLIGLTKKSRKKFSASQSTLESASPAFTFADNPSGVLNVRPSAVLIHMAKSVRKQVPSTIVNRTVPRRAPNTAPTAPEIFEEGEIDKLVAQIEDEMRTHVADR